MAAKITGLTTATTFGSTTWVPIVDTTVTTMDAGGTDLKISPADLVSGAGGSVLVWQGLSAGTAYASSTSLLSVLSGIGTQRGSLTIPANRLQAGSIIRPVLWFLGTVVGTPTLRTVIKLGSTSLMDWTSGALAATSTNQLYSIQQMTAYQVQTAAGAASKILGFSWVYIPTALSVTGATMGTGGTTVWNTPTQLTFDNSVSNLFDVQVAFSVSNAANKIQFVGGYMLIDD